MKIEAIQIDNYRSFGDANEFTFDSNIVGLIGQNGIGKTNALQAIPRLKFFTDDVPTVIPESAINQNTGELPRVSLFVRFEESDLSELGELAVGPYQHDVHEDLKALVSFQYDSKQRRTRLSFAGLIFNSFGYHPVLLQLRKDAEPLIKHLKTIHGWVENNDYAAVVEMLEDNYGYFIPRVSQIVKWSEQNLPNIVGEAWKEKAVSLVASIGKELLRRYDVLARLFPVVVLFEDAAEFPNAYDIDEVAGWDQRLERNGKIALERYLKAVEISRDDLVKAFKSEDIRVRESLRARIIKRTRDLMVEFNRHYRGGAAGIEMNVGFDGRYLRFSVGNADDDGGVPWTDASAGVRWYLCAFFELRQALKNRNVLVLVDEPAIHLHVKAQREVLRLLQGLAHGSQYVLYTTHSPYLLDVSRLGDVRAVVREGNCSFFRALSQMDHVPSRLEALTPVCEALGYDMSASLVPNVQRINLVVEGKTDACYVNTMLDVLGVADDERPFILHSQGAPSIHALVSIFVGWGVPFRVLLDSDAAGRETAQRLRKTFGRKILECVFSVSRSKDKEIESLVAKGDVEKTCPDGIDPRTFEHSKTLRATRFSEVFGRGKERPDRQTCDNFGCLFDAMGILEYDQDVIMSRELEEMDSVKRSDGYHGDDKGVP